MKLGVLVLVVAAACSSPPSADPQVHVADDSKGTRDAVIDMIGDLVQLTATEPQIVGKGDNRCVDDELDIYVELADVTSYTIDETRCGDHGHGIVIRGKDSLSLQFGIYDFVEHLGVRYFHPEKTLYPTTFAWPKDPIRVRAEPSIAQRSFHLHTTHPIELSPPLDANPDQSAIYERNWISWNVKVRSNLVDGYEDKAAPYADERGFPRTSGINLVETQQGGIPVIDPTSSVPEHDQIAAAIERTVAPVDGRAPVSQFEFSFNPSEFTTADETLTVDRISFVTSYLAQTHPEIEVRTINHGTAEAPGPTYGVRFFDLSQFAPASLGVLVHPLMFYDLDRPAPVYGNDNFNFLRDWSIAQQAQRRITYYPETAWWLTFDVPVPLYLAPVSLEARDHDLQTLGPYLQGDNSSPTGVIGHKAFTSGQEWGYWLIDYCTARMTWDTSLGWVGCIDYVTQVFENGDALRDLIVEVGNAQVDPMRDPNLISMFVGSDDSTETALLAGIVFHPLPPKPADVLGWADDKVADFTANTLDRLPALADQYSGWADRADAIAAAQDDTHGTWVREIADSLRITGLRAAHAHEIYTTALALRAAINAHDYTAVDAAAAGVDKAKAITEQARTIVQRREAEYRYPLALSTVGDEVGTAGAIPNATIYPYRYLSRTHRLFYWTRPDDQLSALFGFDVVAPSARMIHPAAPLTIAVTAMVTDLAIAWGDGATSTMLEPHTYAAEGLYAWTLDALQTGGGVIHHEDQVGVAATIEEFPKGSITINQPMGGSLIAGLLPGFTIGLGNDGSDFTLVGQLDTMTDEITNGSIVRRTGTADLPVRLAGLGSLTIYGAAIAVSGDTLTITGQISTDEIIQLVITAGGFDPDGARQIVASTLGYTVDSLPAKVDFNATAPGHAL